MTREMGIYFDVVAILELFENGLATPGMLAAELRSIRNAIGEDMPTAVREEAIRRAARVGESTVARIQ